MRAGYEVLRFDKVAGASQCSPSTFDVAVIEADLDRGDGLVLANRLRMPGRSILPVVLFDRDTQWSVLGQHLGSEPVVDR